MAKQSNHHPNYGGKREGAGRKPEALSVRQAKAFQDAADKLAKKYGKTMQEVIGEQVYDPEASRKDVQTAANLFWKFSVIGATEGGEADKYSGPAVFLPEKHPRLELANEGKK